MAACKCSICNSDDVKNNRLRACGVLQKEGKNFLIDVSPDIRQVALKYRMMRVDGVFLTHPHEDHIGGMNDLRSFSFLNHMKIPLILSQATLDVLQIRFDYLLDRFDVHLLKEQRGVSVIEGLKVLHFTYSQEHVLVTGFRVGDFAYVTDIKNYAESIFEDLDGVKTLVLGAIHETESRMHFSIREAIAFKERIHSVERCYLTHLSHEVDYETINRALPEGVMLAYDGLNIDV